MKVNLNIDAILKALPEWDFSVTFDGVAYATRKAEQSDIQRMTGTTGKKIDEMLLIVESLFVVKPEIKWTGALATAFLESYMEYFANYSNSGAVEAGIAARVAVKKQWEKPAN